ncbi:MAG: hypothetical protein EPO55_05615 [Reyranella sp.]|uniref:hypothetical protein n=1 Tax=Reyranella sp. TaxID=1929291 RepID=UPI0012243A96|nr:hypothetical protein [Reyranella sp.]TAJ41411.1 MAG: hypothetical protein EPO55_05615 [Reyranella sp.]
MDDLTVARAIHVLAVIHWFGGVAFVTAVILPAIAALEEPSRRFALFEAIEHRFSAQVKISVPVAGLSGAWMVWRLDAWSRFLEPAGWWLAAMALVWLLFMAILFVVEPLLLRGWFHRHVAADPAGTFRRLQRAHAFLLLIGTTVSAAGVFGAHGLLD